MYSIHNLQQGIHAGLILAKEDISNTYQPQLVVNDLKKGRKTLEYLLENLSTCRKFRFAVAFITRSGVACLHQTLKDLAEKSITGEILVSRYLSFSDPYAIKLLQSFGNIEIKFISAPNYHGKTYIFDFDEFSRLLIGSSNLTQDALGKNTEINFSTSISRNSNLYLNLNEYMKYWSNSAEVITDPVWKTYLESWSLVREMNKNNDKKFTELNNLPSNTITIQPNLMQIEALQNLREIRNKGLDKSLVISATGTGKTVLSALDVKQTNSKRLLFVVHRLNIAKKAISEFKRVFGNSKTMGLYSSSEELNISADFIFSTVQTINSEYHLSKFNPKDFDYIIIDETHRAGAATYRKVIDYFKPKFLLGMTATPERTDGFDIFSLFNHSIAYEIRLQKALEVDLLIPFHYFGVSDLRIDGQTIDDKSEFNKLVNEDRVKHILSTLREYGCDNGIPRGLVFCSRIDEAKQLASIFTSNGLKSQALTGTDSEEERELAIQHLEDNGESKLYYLFTVDIFNEGVDIPMINQVVMLRATSSSIIFVQQLGRGLRKANGKEYLTVIDFIGNYENNYMIPIALFGDTSFNKDKLRRLLNAGSSLIPGASSVSFDRVAKELIFESIDKAKINTRKLLTEDFKLLQFRLGRLPLMMDFIESKTRDPFQYVESSNSLLEFTLLLEPTIKVSIDILKLLGYFSKHVCDGVRLEECVLLKLFTTYNLDSISLEYFQAFIFDISGITSTLETIKSSIHNFNLNFITERSEGKTRRVSELTAYELVKFDNYVITSGKTIREIRNNQILLNYFSDLANCGVHKFLESFEISNFIDGFKRETKYTRKDIFRILKWDKRPNELNVGGYSISSDVTNCPIFATYEKSEAISSSTKYEDKFLTPQHLVYMSKNRRDLNSPDVKQIANQHLNNIRIPFFAKKNNDEGLDFYYLGELKPLTNKFEETTMTTDDGHKVSVVKMEFLLDKPVDFRLYKYLTYSESSLEISTNQDITSIQLKLL